MPAGYTQTQLCLDGIGKKASATYTKSSGCPDLSYQASQPDHRSRYEGASFIYKRVPKSFFDISRRIAEDFPSSCRLRTHVDANSQESILIYPYFRDTLLSLIQDDPGFAPDERWKIMLMVGEAVQELHAKGWAHAGTCDFYVDTHHVFQAD
jgi:hypothetical protein